jgi:5-methyltetrahydrofolate--homocysteine methyltransferase
MMPLASLLKERVVLLDGATGTELMARGLPAGECPERWNIDYPDRVKDVHRSYYEAGSDIVFSNTFGGNRIKLEPYGLEKKTAEINKRAASLLKEACPKESFAAGDIGPTGKFLKPVGPYGPEDFEEVFEEQAMALREGGADLIVIETMYDLEEARSALRAARGTGLPVFVTLTFSKKKRGYFTLMGNRPLESMQILAGEGAMAVGCNCSLDALEMAEMIETLGDARLSAHLMVKPNAGQPRIDGENTVYDADPDHFLGAIKKMIARGAGLVGGCCGTSPLFIRKLAGTLKKIKNLRGSL